MIWPNGKKCALAFIDDTDDAVYPDIESIYKILISNGIRPTKTIWVYPVRDVGVSYGDDISTNENYYNFIKYLQSEGCEIALHNVGSGPYLREEIISGLDLYKSKIGSYPRIHVNHSYNPDNIYCGEKRYSEPFSSLLKIMFKEYTGFSGDEAGSAHFWGDLHKKHIKYSRSFETDVFNLLNVVDFPFIDDQFSEFCNYFYPSVFCSNQDLFAKQISERNLDNLIKERGCSIIYTHFGYFSQRGNIEDKVLNSIRYIKERSSDIWVAPVGDVLDYMMSQKRPKKISMLSRWRLEALNIISRISNRYIHKLDDFHYKKKINRAK